MREHRQARRFEFSPQQHPGPAFGNEVTPSLRTAECEIGRAHAGTRDDAVEGLSNGRKSPHRAETGMADQQVATAVQRQPVGTAGAAVQMSEYADLGDQSTGG